MKLSKILIIQLSTMLVQDVICHLSLCQTAIVTFSSSPASFVSHTHSNDETGRQKRHFSLQYFKWRDKERTGWARRGQEGQEGDRRGKEGTGGARRGQEEQGGARRGKEGTGGERRGQEGQEEARRGQEGQGEARRGQEGQCFSNIVINYHLE